MIFPWKISLEVTFHAIEDNWVALTVSSEAIGNMRRFGPLPTHTEPPLTTATRRLILASAALRLSSQ